MDNNYKGVIIEESLENKDILKDIKIISTKIEPVQEKHKTPWVKQWTLHNVEIPENKANDVAEILSKALDNKHSWYTDFKNDTHHYIIFRGKFFKVARNSKTEYAKAVKYGLTLGIPDYQLDFSPHMKLWER